MKKYLKILLPLLFALAVVFGLSQRKSEPTTYDYQGVLNDPKTQAEVEGYYTKAQQLAGREANQTSATFLAVGDVMLSRNVAGTVQKNGGDASLPFQGMADTLRSVDFSFANLESPFSGKDDFNPSGSMVFNAPRFMIKGLVDYKFKIVNLANNHALDQGAGGVTYTNEFLDQNHIKHIGTGKTLAEAWSPEIVEANGIRIGFAGASYSSINDNGATTNDYVARMEDTDRLKSDIEFLKTQCDYVVVTIHAGTEYTRQPNQMQKDFAHTAINAGADMVIGAHPHWVQTIEKYNGKYIFYSLGNFIFDQEWSQDTKEGLVLKITLKKPLTSDLQGSRVPAQLGSVELLPVIIENYSTPRPANADESKKILDKIGQTETVLK